MLLLIAALAIADYLVLNRQIKVNEAFAPIVNISGRQRMLTHRTAFLSQIIAQSEAPSPAITEEFKNTINDLASAHQSFIDGEFGELPPDVHDLFFASPSSLDQQMLSYLELLRSFHSSYSEEPAVAVKALAQIAMIIEQGRLVADLERVVDAYQQISEQEADNLRWLGRMILTINLIALLILGLLLFRPMLRRLKIDVQRLTESEAYNQKIIDTAVDAIITIDKSGIVEVFNPAAEKMFGYSMTEVIGQQVNMLMPEPHRSQHSQYISNYINTGKAKILGVNRELTAMRSNGEVFPMYLAVAELEMKSQQKFLGIIRDLTEQKAAEQKITSLNATLEQKVIDRTRALAEVNECLQQENHFRQRAEQRLTLFTKELERSNQELEQFAYVASHDLQEPLRKILTFGGRLEKADFDQLSEKGRNYLERMLLAAGRMQSLINDLLAYSRVTTKAHPFETVNLNELIQAVVSDLEVSIESTRGHIDVAELESIQGDPVQLRQLFQNLLSNALKFHKHDCPPLVKIKGEITRTNPPSNYVISVEDNGIGFDEKYLDRIFVPFQRLHGREAYQGTGIGLAICKKIVERHGGTLNATSKPQRGATFIVSLPTEQTVIEEHSNYEEKGDYTITR